MGYSPRRDRTFRFDLTLGEKERREGALLLDLPGLCRCEVRKIGGDPALSLFEIRENYPGRRPGAEDLALEAEIFLASDLHPDWQRLRIGVPLAEIPEVTAFSLVYDLATFRLVAPDGRTLAEEFPFGDPPAAPPAAAHRREIPPPARESRRCDAPLHLWSPAGLNDWVGDVALLQFDGVLHIFFLFDHRHHGSKFGGGGHSWAHLATRDLRHWRDDGVVLPVAEQWISYGTGTPFPLDGGIALAYGYHTERFLPAGIAPEGASWATTEDGIRYTPSKRIFDTTRNPSVYAAPGGGWYCFQGYGRGWLQLLKAERWPEFQVVADRVVPSGDGFPTGNCLDCPAWFEWHGWSYLMVGFTGMWRGRGPALDDREELAAAGNSIYDGVMVPMVTPYDGDRRLLAGWLRVNGWGGVLVMRELVWFDDGIPGIRWLDETMPEFGPRQPFPAASCDEVAAPAEFAAELRVNPARPLVITLAGEGTPVEFRLDAAKRTASFRQNGEVLFELRRLRGVDAPFRLRLAVRDERKWCGVIVDIEIAGCRTMIRHFPGTHIRSLQMLGDAVGSWTAQ